MNGLERITVPALQIGEMGYESLLCYDISDYRDGNPWREDMALTTLPVYRNGSYDASGAGIPLGLGEEEIREERGAGISGGCGGEEVRAWRCPSSSPWGGSSPPRSA